MRFVLRARASGWVRSVRRDFLGDFGIASFDMNHRIGSGLRWQGAGFFRRANFVAFLVAFTVCSLPPGVAQGDELGSASLQIAGSQLLASPLAQTVPFDTPTIVHTTLQGYDAGLGALPGDLRVVAELSGPDFPGPIQLTTLPNEPFRIPRLRLKGEYVLDDIRLIQGGQLLGYASPRAVTIQVTKLLITRVSARAMTHDEIKSHGIVLDEDNYQALYLAFGFAVDDGEPREYAVPVILSLHETDGTWEIPENHILLPTSGPTAGIEFVPPRLTPFKIDFKEKATEQPPAGGCDPRGGDCRNMDGVPAPMVGAIVFPTDISLLHQFFSVVLMVQNGAPAHDPLTLRDLKAKITLPSGLRQAETEPPTPLGVPVPLRVAGPDGEIGTGDDLTLVVATAEAEAEFVVEGLREGTHIVEFAIEGWLDGMPEGSRMVAGQAKGAVVVRDPTLAIDIGRPDVVRAGEEFDLILAVTNLGNAPVNALDLAFDPGGLAGAEIVDPADMELTIGDLLPGESRAISVELRSLLTGRVIASSARTTAAIRPTFSLGVQIGRGPLSPESFSLPRATDELPLELRRPAVGLIGLAHSLIEAPPRLQIGQPAVKLEDMNERIYRLAQAGRHIQLGEELPDAVAVLAAEWGGSRDAAWEWDRLQRQSKRGRELAAAIGAVLAAAVDTGSNGLDEAESDALFARFGRVTHFLRPQALIATGQSVTLEVESRVSGKRLHGYGASAVRHLPFGELYPLGGAELAVLTQPEAGGYRARLRATASGYAGLSLLLPADEPGGDLLVASWHNVLLPAGAIAELTYDADDAGSLALAIDADGDGDTDQVAVPDVDPLAPRPFAALGAHQNVEVDPSSHVVEILFSEDLALDALLPREPGRFVLPNRVSNGGLTPTEVSQATSALGVPGIENPLEGKANQRVVRVVFNNSISPLLENMLETSDLISSQGVELGSQDIEIQFPPSTLPGARVEGAVIDPAGQALPYTEVSLFEWDYNPDVENPCQRHRTARTRADVNGRFQFDYVRQTQCGKRFQIEAIDPARPYWGQAEGVVRFPGETQQLSVVMLGRATVQGHVTYSDGSVPPGLQVFAHNPVFNEYRKAWTDEDGNYRMAEVVVGTVMLMAYDELGNKFLQTIEVPVAGAEITRNLVILRQPAAAVASVAGSVINAADGEPTVGAFVLLALDGTQMAVKKTDAEGLFDFGTVPTGTIELTVYHPATGVAGARLAFDLQPDQAVFQELIFRDDRATIQGVVRRIAANGDVTPVEGAVVWLEGLPYNTRSAADGSYELPDVLTGSWTVTAADLEAEEKASVAVTVINAGEVRHADLYFRSETQEKGAIQGLVLDFDGQPVRNALVHLAGDYWSTNWWHEARTDNAGVFRIEGLEPAIYGVHAISGQEGGLAMAQVLFPGHVANVTVLFRRGIVRGRTITTDSEGNEIGVQSQLSYRPVEVVGDWQVVAVAKDFYRLNTEPDGTFEIEALHGPFEVIAHNAFHGTKRFRVEVSDIPVDLTIEYERNGMVAGTVFGPDGATPAPGVQLALRGGQFDNYQVTSDAGGRFRFELLPAGSYLIEATSTSQGILRKTRVHASLRMGEELEIEVELPLQGTVEGKVVDAGGQPVANAVVSLRESNWPYREFVHNSDATGYYSFGNVLFGPFKISARSTELGGLGGRTQGAITFEGEEVFTEIQLEGAGELAGRILNPETGLAVPNAQVKLRGMSFIGWADAITTDFEGRFRFERLPLGTYFLHAFDPSTGRNGRSEAIVLANHDEVVESDLVLEVRGIVDGHLYNPPSQAGVPGATIKIVTDSITRLVTFSSTDIDGYFEFGGIPEGEFRLETVVDGRKAQGEGEIAEEDERVTVDLSLEELARLTGSVYAPRQAGGDSQVLAPNVNVMVYDNAKLIAATTQNPFSFDGLLPNRYLRILVLELDGAHSVEDTYRLGPGQERNVEMALRAIGATTVVVKDSNDQPLTNVQVHLSNRYRFLNGRGVVESPHQGLKVQSFDGSTGAADRLVFEGVREGYVDVLVTNPVNGLKGRASGTVEYEGHGPTVTVKLQPIGTVDGTVLLSDGVTPAEGATVALKPQTMPWRLVDSDAEGLFALEEVPLGTYQLVAAEAEGPGTRVIDASLVANAEVDTYTIVLDDADPLVDSIAPANGALDLPINTTVAVRFTEPMLNCGQSCTTWLRLTKLAGDWVPVTYVWSEQDQTVTLVPTAPLASNTAYKISVVQGMLDPAKRRLPATFTSAFTTADVAPPKVIDVLPRANTKQVPVAGSVQVTFSEPIDQNSMTGAFELVNLDTGLGTTMTALLTYSNRRVVLTPTADLPTDTEFELRVHGIADPVGNVQAGTFTSRFVTVDQTPPTIEWSSPAIGQVYTSGSEVVIRANVTDRRGMASVVFTLGEWSKTVTSAPWEWRVPAPIATAAGPRPILAVAKDLYGNQTQSSREIYVEPLDDAANPTVVATCPAVDDFVAPGVALTLSVAYSDDLKVESVAYSVDGVFKERSAQQNKPAGTVAFTWQPPLSATPGQVFQVSVELRDYAGKTTTETLALTVPTGRLLKAGNALTSSSLPTYVAAGTYPLAGNLILPGLTLMQGAIVGGDATAQLVLAQGLRQQCGAKATVAGVQAPTSLHLMRGSTLTSSAMTLSLESADVVVEQDAVVDADGKGYAGAAAAQAWGAGLAPAGVTPAGGSTGASHGGLGTGLTLGEIYGSPFAAELAGAGGGAVWRPWPQVASRGGNGGGAIAIVADHVQLDGLLSARGEQERTGYYSTFGGAGGAVQVVAEEMAGGGRIDVRGAAGSSGSGGGGRIALLVADPTGFDPASQTTTVGGDSDYANEQAGTGTVYARRASSTYGSLWLTGDADSVAEAPTHLPKIGEGIINSVVAAAPATDLWIVTAEPAPLFGVGVEGGFLRIGGLDYRIAEESADRRRLRLTGAAGVVTAGASYEGLYKFDTVSVGGGADFQAFDGIEAASATVLPHAKISGDWSRTDLALGAAAELELGALEVRTLSLGADATLKLDGSLTTEALTLAADARLELTNAAASRVEVAGAIAVGERAELVATDIEAASFDIATDAIVRATAFPGLNIDVEGLMTVAAGAKVDVSGQGYTAVTSGQYWGGAPPGVLGAKSAGGSHGGSGSKESNGNAPGAIFDSVYRPHLGGGGGSDTLSVELSSGGGTLTLRAGELELEGSLQAKALDFTLQTNSHNSVGAGGTILVEADRFSGSGILDASGGRVLPLGSCGGGAGGGGRIALHVEDLDLDPTTQANVSGGFKVCSGVPSLFAAPGTIYWKTADSTFGALLLDAESHPAGGGERPVGTTGLPTLGSGSVSNWSVDGEDAWLQASPALSAGAWLGAWVELKNASEAILGTFEVSTLGPQGLRLRAAAAISGAATFQGRYRFDTISVVNGAGLTAVDPVDSSTTELKGNVAVGPVVTATNLVVKSGAVVRPATGGSLTFHVSGRLTVEAGARIDVTGRGYATCGVPAGTTIPQSSPGSHGGQGTIVGGLANSGDIYGSVYQPRQLGGGGCAHPTTSTAGGGTIEVVADEVVVEGSLLARGASDGTKTPGAGGSILVRAAQLSGAGTIDARGGSSTQTNCNTTYGGGGGGRVALYVDQLAGFDPALQAVALAGSDQCSTGARVAGTGTLFLKMAADTWGTLVFDHGLRAVGATQYVRAARLPTLGNGAILTFTAHGGDAWLTRTGGFPEAWHGVWVELLNGAGVTLGVFEAVERDTQGRLLLAHAGAHTTAAAYVGRYRFDQLLLKNGASFDAIEKIEGEKLEIGGVAGKIGTQLMGAEIVVKAGTFHPLSGGTLELTASEKLTIETGAVLDVSGRGYAGSVAYTATPGGAPALVAGAKDGGGASHGGRGSAYAYSSWAALAGEVYDSVYSPSLGGGGGGSVGGTAGTAGAGVIVLRAPEIQLDGELRARGVDDEFATGVGAGGTIALETELMAGAGLIDASGGSVVDGNCWAQGAGGGGRVALIADDLGTFDIAQQVVAKGGSHSCLTRNGGTGTIFSKTAAQTYGTLRVDSGALGAETVEKTPLPMIGVGVIGSATVDTVDAENLWVEPQDSATLFSLGVRGMWLRVAGVDYRVLAEDPNRRRILLDGAAGAVAVGQEYRGIYKFDTVQVKGKAGVELTDHDVIGAFDVDATASVTLADKTPPVLVSATPADGSVFTSGLAISVAANATDDVAIRKVVFWFGSQSLTDTTSPYGGSLVAPLVTEATELDFVVEVYDAGNLVRLERTLTIVPSTDFEPPTIGLVCAEGDIQVDAGTTLSWPVMVTDNERVGHVRVLVDGVETSSHWVDAVSATVPTAWNVPAEAEAGEVFEVVLRVEDFAGRSATITRQATVAAGVLRGTQSLAGSLSGDVVLGAGTFTASAPLSLQSLTLLQGAVLTAPGTTAIDLQTAGTLAVQCGAKIDATAKGYASAASSTTSAATAPGIVGAKNGGGGSHGGYGTVATSTNGAVVGEVFDSVYQPIYAGGGGGTNTGSYSGTAGGGIVRIVAQEVALAGEILALGGRKDSTTDSAGTGAGGTIVVDADLLSGGGRIDLSGGERTRTAACGSTFNGAGGGGRAALLVDEIDGFDVGSQVKADGGKFLCGTGLTTLSHLASPGSIYVKTTSHTYGDLWVRASNGTPTSTSMLPQLASGAPTALTSSGSDAWLQAASALGSHYVGTWIRLDDAAGVSLGTYRVLAVNGSGHALLGGAGAVIGAAHWRGEYRFDRVIAGGKELELRTTPILLAEISTGAAGLSVTSLSSLGDLSILAGSLLTHPAQGSLTLNVEGMLTIEASAKIDATGRGFAPAAANFEAAGAPGGVLASIFGGGSHGGYGTVAQTGYNARIGEIFDSVYHPSLGGGGGGTNTETGGGGGGVISIAADEIVLEGDLMARGGDKTMSSGQAGAGAGGTILLQTGSLTGPGDIDVSGGGISRTSTCGSTYGGAGGGGRIRIAAAEIEGFDLDAQTAATGGRFLCGAGLATTYQVASPGTVYVMTDAHTYGDLRVKSTTGTPTVATLLPQLGNGAATSLTAQGGNALLQAGSAFGPTYLGTWIRLDDAAGAVLGTYRVQSIDGSGRALLSGAGSVTGATAWRAEYRFDSVLANGIELELRTTPLLVSEIATGPAGLSVTRLEVPGDLVVKANSVLTHPAQGSLTIEVGGRLTVETAAKIDATGRGYPPAAANFGEGGVPTGVTTPIFGGGSHGGYGTVSQTGYNARVGEIFDSVYHPMLGGGGGGMNTDPGGAGGGTISITADEILLQGDLLARGVSRSLTSGQAGGGGGGAIVVDTETLSGAGTIDVSGGGLTRTSSCGVTYGGGGGGGRVALLADTFDGFVPASQVYAQGGRYLCATTTWYTQGGAGTAFVHTSSSTYGSLLVDNRMTNSSTPAKTGLAKIGLGTIGTVTVDSVDSADLWIEPADVNAKFDVGVVGMWVEVDGVDYRVLTENANRRKILLDGAAAAVTTGKIYRGRYKFDAVTVKGRAQLELRDQLTTASQTVDSGAALLTLDATPPALSSVSPADGSTHVAGATIAMSATATDNVAVVEVVFRLGSASSTDSSSPYAWSATAPAVEVATDVEMRVEARDAQHNWIREVRTLHIVPAGGAPPQAPLAAPLDAGEADGTAMVFAPPARAEAMACVAEAWHAGESLPAAWLPLGDVALQTQDGALRMTRGAETWARTQPLAGAVRAIEPGDFRATVEVDFPESGGDAGLWLGDAAGREGMALRWQAGEPGSGGRLVLEQSEAGAIRRLASMTGLTLPLTLAVDRRGDVVDAGFETAEDGYRSLMPRKLPAPILSDEPVLGLVAGLSLAPAEFAGFELCRAVPTPTPSLPASVPCAADEPLDVVFVVDASAFSATAFDGVDRLAAAALAADQLQTWLAARQDGSRSALLTYGESGAPLLLRQPFVPAREGTPPAQLSELPWGVEEPPIAAALAAAGQLLRERAEAGHRPAIVWLSAGLPPVTLIDGDRYRDLAEVAWSGEWSTTEMAYAGQPAADAMATLAALHADLPALRVHGVALQGDGVLTPRFPEELLGFAADLSLGSSISAAERRQLLAELPDLFIGLTCAGR
jgi:hypothetical protein